MPSKKTMRLIVAPMDTETMARTLTSLLNNLVKTMLTTKLFAACKFFDEILFVMGILSVLLFHLIAVVASSFEMDNSSLPGLMITPKNADPGSIDAFGKPMIQGLHWLMREGHT